ncbi:hypothetical protein KSX_84010 [Ktedonospora formicarum]|uniref:Diguanylate cyclase n=2 Tax=Ktedonospora formicarum TaxID=2778364 RepID=A0A8J3IDF8_9CHLR|nr:hypothetical protein KSX_84010 [Ktedonospora formicarum]
MHEAKERNVQKTQRLGNFIWWSYGLVFGLYLFATLGTTLIISQPDKLVPAQTSLLTIRSSFGIVTYYAVLLLVLVFFIAKGILFVILSSRLLFISGKEGILPAKLTYINRHGTPIVSILVQTVVCATFIFILYMLLTGITNFNPITTQQGVPFYLLLRAISSILWILAIILFLAMNIRYVLRVRHKSRISQRGVQIPGRESTWILGLSTLGIVTLLIGMQQTIAHSWIPGAFSNEHWSLTIITCTLVAIVVGWLCAEIPRKQALLTTLRKVNTREQLLRNQLEEAYNEQQILVEQQQELLIAVEQLYRENALAAVTDPITALPNHRAIISALDEALQETSEKQESMGLLFVDLDRFKQVNDSWGHPAGDAVLHEVGARLKKAIGPSNFVGRYGGEEFAIILRKCDVTLAIEIAEKMRLSIMEKPYLWYAEDTSTPVELTITASIGISLTPYHGETREALLEQADRAMYRAKQSGRNRVCIVMAEEHTRQILTVRGLGSFSSEEICTARALLAAMQAYDQETYEHAQRMVSLSEATARRLKCGSEEIHNVRLAAMFHDIGKIGVPNSILHKPGPLTPCEWEVIRRHPDTGRRILARAGGPFAIVAYIIGAHHERWDGDGYPGGLAGEQIPLSARILSVVDAYDTMVSGRVYREAISDEEARQELRRCAGSQFDVNVVEAFLQSLDHLEETSHEPFISQQAS